MSLSVEVLRTWIQYDLSTGIFIRLKDAHKYKAGEVAGHAHNRGYVAIGVAGRVFLAHRLAWFYIYGAWPSVHLDHIDGDKTNNRLSNLREVNNSLNRQNVRTAQCNSRSKLLGASWHKGRKKWVAQISYAGTNKYLGYFDSAEAAHQAYLAAKRIHHPGCTI